MRIVYLLAIGDFGIRKKIKISPNGCRCLYFGGGLEAHD